MQKRTAVIAGVLWSVIVLVAGATQAPAASSARDIDREIWSALIATVAADDIVGMGRLYYPEAVLVTPKSTASIKETLERWGKDMVANKARGDRATVEFRFSSRLDNSTTAFEAGIFKYTVISKAGESRPQFVTF